MAVDVRRLSTLAKTLVLIAAFVLTAVLAPAGGARTEASALGLYPTLYVNYALDCTFTITDDSGNPVHAIPPGAYEVDVSTSILFSSYVQSLGPTNFTGCQGHAQFQLTGPGVSIYTTLFNGCSSDQILPVQTFQPSSTYVAQDNNQSSVARVLFTTLATGSPTAPTAPYTSTSSGPGTASTDVVGSDTASAVPFRGTLAGAVSAAGKLTLTYKGKGLTTLVAGRYTVAVADHSRQKGFVLQEIHRAATTLAEGSFVGKRSTTIDLKAGQWFFYPTSGGAKSYFVVVVA
jgi:hypothetical protein